MYIYIYDFNFQLNLLLELSKKVRSIYLYVCRSKSQRHHTVTEWKLSKILSQRDGALVLLKSVQRGNVKFYIYEVGDRKGRGCVIVSSTS